MVAVILGIKWKEACDKGRRQATDPFRNAGNHYDVGANYSLCCLQPGWGGPILAVSSAA
jgi:hypothetical protein